MPHFLLPLDGGFFSEAWRYGKRSENALVFTPGGCEHRDSMARLGGRFAIVSLDPEALGADRLSEDLPDYTTADLPIEAHAIAHQMVSLALSPDVSIHRMEVLGIQLFTSFSSCASAVHPDRIIDRCLEIWEEAPGTGIAELAATLGVSSRALAATFRCAQTNSPREWRTWCMASRAASALRSHGHAISAVAADIGFSDQSHLTRQFRRFFRLTPNAYRQLFEAYPPPPLLQLRQSTGNLR